jgi:hypothetical protein
MKPSMGFIALLTLGLMTTGCEDKRIPALEKRVGDLEQKTKQLEADKTKAADEQSQKEVNLQVCVAAANDQYQQNIMSNGTKSRDGRYSVPTVVMTELDHQKQSKIEECRLLYR